MRALHDVVRSGKARYIGASSMYAWQFAKAQFTADLGGWTRFVAMQNRAAPRSWALADPDILLPFRPPSAPCAPLG